MSKTIVKFLPPEEVSEELSGWWILSIDGTTRTPRAPATTPLAPTAAKKKPGASPSPGSA